MYDCKYGQFAKQVLIFMTKMFGGGVEYDVELPYEALAIADDIGTFIGDWCRKRFKWR